MDSLLKEVMAHLTPETVSQLGQAVGTDPKHTESAIAAALPMIVGGLSRNTLSDPNGAQALNSALQRDHDGGLLDTLEGMFGGAMGGGTGGTGGATSGAGNGAGGGILGGILGSVFGGAAGGGNAASGGLGARVDSVLGKLGRDTRTAGSGYTDTPVDTGPTSGYAQAGRSQGTTGAAGAAANAGAGGGLIDILRGKDGDGILGHIFGSQRDVVQSGVGKASGLDAGTVGRLMALLAPIVMSALGRMRKANNLGADGLTQVLDQDRKRIEHAMPNTSEGGLLSLLDSNRDGKVDASEASAKLAGVLGMFKA